MPFRKSTIKFYRRPSRFLFIGIDSATTRWAGKNYSMNKSGAIFLVVLSQILFSFLLHAENLTDDFSYFIGEPPNVEWRIYRTSESKDVVYQKLPEVPVDIFWAESGDTVIFRIANEIFEASWPEASKKSRIALIPNYLRDKVIRIWRETLNGTLHCDLSYALRRKGRHAIGY